MDKLAYRPEEAAELASVGRTTIYELITSGQLDSFKVGRARLIPHAALVAYIERQCTVQGRGAARRGA